MCRRTENNFTYLVKALHPYRVSYWNLSSLQHWVLFRNPVDSNYLNPLLLPGRMHTIFLTPSRSLLLFFLSYTFTLLLVYRGRGTALSHLVFFFFFFSIEKKINIFRLMHIALFIKVTYYIQIILKKKLFFTVFLIKLLFQIIKSVQKYIYIHDVYRYIYTVLTIWHFGERSVTPCQYDW